MKAQQGTSDRNDILHVLCYLLGQLAYVRDEEQSKQVLPHW